MDERIKELAKQSGLWFVTPREDLIDDFAELIVRECARIAVFKDDGYIATADVAGHMAAGRVTAARLIKEHFGVK